MIEVRNSHPENTLLPIVVTLGGMAISSKKSQRQNAESPIVVTLGGMVIEVRLEQ